MTTKSTPPETKKATPRSEEELPIAYEVHTLAQMALGHIAATNQWMALPVGANELAPGFPVRAPSSWPGSWAYPIVTR